MMADNTDPRQAHNVGDAITAMTNGLNRVIPPPVKPVPKPRPDVVALAMIEEAATVLLEHTAPTAEDLRERLQYIQGVAHAGHDLYEDDRCPRYGCGSYLTETVECSLQGGGTAEVQWCKACDRPFDERGLVCSS